MTQPQLNVVANFNTNVLIQTLSVYIYIYNSA
jgi:hypothetical protein